MHADLKTVLSFMKEKGAVVETKTSKKVEIRFAHGVESTIHHDSDGNVYEESNELDEGMRKHDSPMEFLRSSLLGCSFTVRFGSGGFIESISV